MELAVIIGIILFLPLLSFLLLFSLEKKLSRKTAGLTSILIIAFCFILSFFLFIKIWGNNVYQIEFIWFSLNSIISFKTGILLDNYACAMLLIVTFVSLLVFIYSFEYFKKDHHYNRFFAYLCFFIFSIEGIIISNNLLITFMFWELVGFSSYLLIGFWFNKEMAALAAKKAFLTNRIADVFFLIAIFFLYDLYKTFNISELKTLSTNLLLNEYGWVPALGIFLGCMGKSAQFPFQIWLPNAMEGPTPVSALIHAATMVAAGIFLMVKISFLITPGVSNFILIIGSLTAFIGAFCALTQNDLKKVLAFSTISQLGFMMTGIGIGAYEAAFFHLVTHAFFKACLFLSAGSVIHAFHHIKHDLKLYDLDEQDMRYMGGLRKQMPLTFAAYLVSGLSLAGLPFFSGFLSKDAIILAVFNKALGNNLLIYYFVMLSLLITASLTAFYITKQLLLIFSGELRLQRVVKEEIRIHENSKIITIPLLLLAFFSTTFIFSFNPFNSTENWVMGTLIINPQLYGINHKIVAFLSATLSLTGILAAAYLYKPSKEYDRLVYKESFLIRLNPLYKLSYHHLFLDKMATLCIIKPAENFAIAFRTFDIKVIDFLVNTSGVCFVIFAHITSWADRFFVDGSIMLAAFISRQFGNIMGKIQGGKIQLYFLWALLFLCLIITYFIFS